MYKGKRIAVVVPAHNEETQIGRVIDTMPDFIDAIVIIDDCSKDRTAEIVSEYATRNPRVVLIRHEQNRGVGGAIASGYKWALANDFDAAAVMAGDGQMDPVDLPALLDPVVADFADYSKGNRLVSGEAFRKIPKVRFFGNSALSLLTKIASGYWHVADSQTGYTVINKRALRAIDWDAMYQRYGQPNDLLVRLNIAEMRVIDIPIEPVYGVGERSGIRVRKVLFTIGWLLVRLFFMRLTQKYIIRDFHPLVFFYAMSFLAFMVSGLLTLRLIALWIAQGAVPEMTALALVFTSGISFQSAFFAMWFDYESNKHLVRRPGDYHDARH